MQEQGQKKTFAAAACPKSLLPELPNEIVKLLPNFPISTFQYIVDAPIRPLSGTLSFELRFICNYLQLSMNKDLLTLVNGQWALTIALSGQIICCCELPLGVLGQDYQCVFKVDHLPPCKIEDEADPKRD